MPTAGLPEKPSVSDADLRACADAMSRQWEMVPASTRSDGLSKRLLSLKQRLTEVLRTCKKTASIHELTPELELLESTRMLESALIAGDNTAETFASLPHVRVDKDSELPRAINLTEGYLVAAKGIWSDESLTVYVQQAQQRDALLLEEITVLPQALKLAQLAELQGENEKARAHYESALALDPEQPEARYNLGNLYDDAGEAARAVEDICARGLEGWLRYRDGVAERMGLG